MTGRARALAALVAAALVGGCGGSPEPRYYALAPEAGPRHGAGPRLIELRTPAVAAYLDRERIVARVVNYRMDVAAGDRWAEPFADMIGRVLAEDLSERLPASTVFTEAAGLTADPDAVVDVDVQRLEAGQDGVVTLRAQVAVESAGRPREPVSRPIFLQARPPSPGTMALVATMSALLARLADEIAVLLPQRISTSP